MSVTQHTATPISLYDEPSLRPLLTVVVPVYNGGEEITENVAIIRQAITDGLGHENFETIVVSDGSVDGTAERLVGSQDDPALRVIHYDRNLGKGHAVKVGALAAHGDWVAIVDADLDLDPGFIPMYLRVARTERLDIVIGSKRHPDSVVHYPRSRRFGSWCYQLLIRLLFRLDVRDTQVGLKVLRREVVERVVPLLLVKRFAFDLELLTVARALGYTKVRELPVRLEYRFTLSGVRSRAVARALWDTAAIFYRLRILRTYQRKRELLGGVSLPADELPLVTVVGDQAAACALDYPRLEVVAGNDSEVLNDAGRGLVAVLAPGARPSSNWLSVAVPYLARGQATAVVVPTIAPPSGPLVEQAAAAILESRLGGGSRRFRHLPGNVRLVSDHPAESCVVQRGDLREARAASVDAERLVAWFSTRGRRTVYTPDASISSSPPPLLRPHLCATLRYGEARGAAARRTRGRSVSTETALSLAPTACALFGLGLLGLGPQQARGAAVGLITVYAVVVASSAILAALRFRSASVGALVAPSLIFTQVTYAVGFLRGLLQGR